MNTNELFFRRRRERENAEESRVYDVLLPNVCVLRIFSARGGKLPRPSIGALFARANFEDSKERV